MNYGTSAKRGGISEVTASVLVIAMTIIAGAAVFGYVNSQAGVSERQLGASVGNTVASLEEQFVVAQIGFSSTTATLYLYNSGKIDLQIAQITLYNLTNSAKNAAAKPMNLVFTGSSITCNGGSGGACSGGSCGSVSSNESPVVGTGTGAFRGAQGVVSIIALTLPSGCYTGQFISTDTYTVKVLGANGNTVSYSQSR